MIDVLIPCLGRPLTIEPLIESFEESTNTVGCHLHFIVSYSDTPVRRALRDADQDFIVATWKPGRGDYARKMNLAYRQTVQPWILLGAQDIRFHPGWDGHALSCAMKTGKRVIGTNDLGNRESLRTGSFSTHPLVARSYAVELGTIDEPGKLVTEVYDHNWVDRELAETAEHRREWHYCRASVIEHLHPAWGKGVNDDTYRKGMRNFGSDRKLYLSRRPLWKKPSRLERERRVRGRR